MTREEQLLTCLSEECAEVIKEVCKVQRFGAEDVGPSQVYNNRERLELEIVDFLAVLGILVDEGIVNIPPSTVPAYKLKRERVLSYIKETKQ